jgi:hypothetical protein
VDKDTIKINYQGGGRLKDFIPKEARIDIYYKEKIKIKNKIQELNRIKVILVDIKELIEIKKQVDKTLKAMTGQISEKDYYED